MAGTRTCAGCNASLPEGVPDVFCPACALRRALAVGSEGRSEEGFWSLRRLHRLFTRKQADQAGRSQQMLLASLENKAGYCLPVSTGAPSPGEVVGGYEILERIGGNMGLVFKARHQMLDKVVVLKLVPADCIADPARLTRLWDAKRPWQSSPRR